MKKLIALFISSALAALMAACSNTSERAAITSSAPTANGNLNRASANTSAHAGTANDNVPAIVRAALADAQTITTQHRDISESQVTSIEQETSTRISDRDHHAYLGFMTSGGARRQTGAATIVNAGGRQLVIIYESRDGMPYIREVRGEGVPQAFLDQFRGKGHDNRLRLGEDVQANGLDEATARAATDAIRQDTRIMQSLYGAEHTH